MANYNVYELTADGEGLLGDVQDYPDPDDFTLADAVNALSELDEPDADELYNGGKLKVTFGGRGKRKVKRVVIGFVLDADGNEQPFQPVYCLKFGGEK